MLDGIKISKRSVYGLFPLCPFKEFSGHPLPHTMLTSSLVYKLKHTHSCQYWPGEGGAASMSCFVNIIQERGSSRGFEECGIIGQTKLFCMLLYTMMFQTGIFSTIL